MATLDALAGQLEALKGREAALRTVLLAAAEQGRRRDAEVRAALAAQKPPAPAPAPEKSPRSAYQQLVERVRQAASWALPPVATILVVSKGDNELLKLDGRQGWHFPRTEGGVYAGHHPADAAAAVAHLEELRAKGAGFLLLPSTAFWWLDHYADFRRHLDDRYRRVHADADCVIYELAAAAPAHRNGTAHGAKNGTASKRAPGKPAAKAPNRKAAKRR